MESKRCVEFSMLIWPVTRTPGYLLYMGLNYPVISGLQASIMIPINQDGMSQGFCSIRDPNLQTIGVPLDWDIYIFIFINMHIYIFLYHNIDMYTSENKRGPTKMVFWKKINLWGVWVSMFVFGGVCLLSHEGIKELQICDMSMTSIVWTHNSTFVERCRNIWRWTKTTPTKHVAVLFLASSMCVSRGMFCSFGIILWIESVTVWKCLLSK